MSTALFGVAYPFCVWMVGSIVFPHTAEVRAATVEGRPVGLLRVGQPFTSPAYFWSRPSALSKKFLPILVSQGSNLPPSSLELRAMVEKRAHVLRGGMQDPFFAIPEDLIMASASGMDPDISLKAALFQVPRVAAARGISEDELRTLILRHEEPSLFGLFPRRVNVLFINCQLDRQYPVNLFSTGDLSVLNGREHEVS